MKIVLSIMAAAALLLPVTELDAQTDLTNTGILQVSTGADILYVSGSLTNNSGAALTNNGSLYVKQNLINGQAAMAVGAGTLYLNGSSAQTLSGAQVFKTFNLVTSNSGGILLNNNLSVSGTHTFTTGVITTSVTPNYLVYEAGSSYTGDADTRHVKGWVQKAGTTAFAFPLGNGTVERKIAVSNLSLSSVFNANYAGATTNTGNVAAPLNTVDPNEYWIVNEVSGGTAQVDMNWDNSKIAMPNYILADIRVANYIAGNWTQVGGSATGNVTTTGNISSNSLASFGSFALASTTFSLPVTLVQFSANRSNGNTVLNWMTADEVNVSHYEIERSENGVTFYSIADNIAAVNLPGLQHYELTDSKPLNGTAYYRLRSIDTDGKTKLSKVIAVSDRLQADNYFIVTNPAHSSINIAAGKSHNGEYNYHVNTLSGQTLLQGRLNITHGGSYSIPLPANMVSGVYVLEVQYASFRYQQKIMIQ